MLAKFIASFIAEGIKAGPITRMRGHVETLDGDVMFL